MSRIAIRLRRLRIQTTAARMVLRPLAHTRAACELPSAQKRRRDREKRRHTLPREHESQLVPCSRFALWWENLLDIDIPLADQPTNGKQRADDEPRHAPVPTTPSCTCSCRAYCVLPERGTGLVQ